MLAAFFDIPTAVAEGAPFGKDRKAPKPKARPGERRRSSPKPTEASTTTMRTRFEPLPPDLPPPRPAEESGQAWQPLAGSGVTRDDDIAEFRADWWDEDADAEEEPEDASEPDFEPDSLEPCAPEDSVAASPVDSTVQLFFSKRCRGAPPPAAMYTGPQLCYEDDDFD